MKICKAFHGIRLVFKKTGCSKAVFFFCELVLEVTLSVVPEPVHRQKTASEDIVLYLGILLAHPCGTVSLTQRKEVVTHVSISSISQCVQQLMMMSLV